ncbi:MAG: hypothetical protein KC731_10415 [Myxococcales bacterium]|nr:hypothetical protein [Myxococcales bacterium]
MSDVPFYVFYPEGGGQDAISVEGNYIPGTARASRDLGVGAQLGTFSYGVVLKAEYRPIIAWLRELQMELRILETQNNRCDQAQEAAVRWFMTVRGMGGLAVKLGDHGSNFAPDDPDLDRRIHSGVRRLGERLQEQVERDRESFICAVTRLHRPMRERQTEFAQTVQSRLVDFGNVAALVARLGGDDDLTLMTRAGVSGLLASYVQKACEEIAKSSLHSEFAGYCETAAMTSADQTDRHCAARPDLRHATSEEARRDSLAHIEFDSSSVLDTVATVFNIVGGVAGTMPLGTDSLCLSMARVVLTARTLGHQRWSQSQGLQQVERWLEKYVRWIGRLDEHEMNEVMTAAREGGEGNVRRVRDLLGEHFQTGTGFNIAASCFATFQFGFVLYNLEFSQRSGARATYDNVRSALDVPITAAQAASAVIYTIARTEGEEVFRVSTHGIVDTARRARAVIDQLDNTASTFLAVVAIVDGGVLIYDGVVERNAATVACGVCTVGSGIGAALAILFADTAVGATAGPIGIVCGMVAGAIGALQMIIEATQPTAVQAYRALKDAIESSSYADHDACHAMMDRANTLFDYIHEHATDALGRSTFRITVYTSPGAADSVRAELMSVGFSQEQANQLVVVERY